MKVSDVMTAQVASAPPSSTIAQVAKMMVRVESGAVPVTEGGKLVGMITDRDIVVRVVAENRSFETPVSDVMTTNVKTCRKDDNLADATAMMGAHQIRRLVVVHEDGALAGMLSLGDIALDYGSKSVGHTLEEISQNTPEGH